MNFNSPEFWHPNRGSSDETNPDADRADTDFAVESRPDTDDASTVAMAGIDDASSALGAQPDYAYSFDPRLIRFDAFQSYKGIMPFSSDSAASVYYDMVFTVEKGLGQDS
jgi:hypothetical protein